MNHPRLGEVLPLLQGPDALPPFRGARDLRWRLISGGAVNLRLRVQARTAHGPQAWFMRLAGTNSTALGANAHSEALAHAAAASAGFAPGLVYTDTTRGLLVTQWWPGRPWTWRQARHGLPTYAALAAGLHSLPVPIELAIVDLAQATHRLLADLEQPANALIADRLYRLVADAEHQLGDTAADVSSIVHSDPHGGNVLCSVSGALRFVDFEYAGRGDPVHDLAMFVTSHDLNRQQCLALLEAYNAHRPAPTLLHLQIACRLADALWLAWTLLAQGGEALEQMPRARRVWARLAALS
jgi:thiamine kinase-like enzyme